MADVLRQVGNNIRKIRKQKNLSQIQFSDLAEKDDSYISLLERGKQNTTLLNLEQIAKALDVPVTEFFSFHPSIITELTDLLTTLTEEDQHKAFRILREVFEKRE